MFAVLFVK